MLLLRHCRLSSEDLITCERALLRFVSGRAKTVDLDFNVWDYTVPEIYGYILGMFVKLELVECLGITSGELLDFIVDVDRGYRATFYHSFYHAADVTAVLYHMLQGMRASQYLSRPDMAALLLAGLCHDIGHPGLNNLFQVNAKTELVKEYGEASVLEKYSCSLAMDLVTKHALFHNIAHSPSAVQPEGQPATAETMKEAMIKAILATDMSFHYDMLNNLNTLIEATTTPLSSSASGSDSETDPESDCAELDSQSSPPPPTQPSIRLREPTSPVSAEQRKQKTVSISFPLSTASEPSTPDPTGDADSRRHRRQSSSDSACSQDSADYSLASSQILGNRSPADLTPELRQNLCNCLLHAADISNAVKPWTVCKRWSDLVVQEFFRQGDIEKAQGLPVSPNMDRDQHNQPQISLGFGDFVVQPYFEAFVELLPDASPVLTSLANNRDQWLALQQSSQQFGNDPYLSVDPLEDPSTARRPSSPIVPYMPTGRRVSVAAGVLVLDDTQPYRVPRRLRHSTNTEPGHSHRKMKRSLSSRSMSTSLQNLHAGSTRSSGSSGKLSQGQEVLASVLRRQASLTERCSGSTPNLFSHVQLRSFSSESSSPPSSALLSPPAPLPTLHANSMVQSVSSSENQNQDQSKSSDNDSNNNSSVNSKSGKDEHSRKSFRQRRLASLQMAGNVHSSIRQEYGDGYLVLDKPPSGSGQHIPKSQDNPPVSVGAVSASPGQTPVNSATSPSQAGNRSSTPAVMMNKIKYDWVLSPTLPEIPAESRFGFGPLDGMDEPLATTPTRELEYSTTSSIKTTTLAGSSPSINSPTTPTTKPRAKSDAVSPSFRRSIDDYAPSRKEEGGGGGGMDKAIPSIVTTKSKDEDEEATLRFVVSSMKRSSNRSGSTSDGTIAISAAASSGPESA
ncbi:High affinity cAMP-specific and IBMX-insensitive 3',5'-cyclic phosphodiesterase 9A [Mortierella sp. GBA30]|nr:High affinity cAMP-specific and IBMX-insensitive 3',5'-cyclic phosphodiesterase 9A [Mortierella sp. GBA30]